MAAEEIGRALSLLFAPGQVIEVRAITEEGMASGYFDDPEALAAVVAPLDAAGTAGIYVTLNEVNPALLSRRANRIKMRLSKKDATTADTDIIHRRWFPIDIDPVRPSGVSSTNEEHQAAIARAAEIAAYLGRERGWPDPVMADSGNGAHLLYRIDLPNDDESRDLVKRALEALDVIFLDRACTVDTANFNAARIWKLYGTTSRKGDHTGDRPHRRGTLLDVPAGISLVGRELLEALAASLSVAPAAKPEKIPLGAESQSTCGNGFFPTGSASPQKNPTRMERFTSWRSAPSRVPTGTVRLRSSSAAGRFMQGVITLPAGAASSGGRSSGRNITRGRSGEIPRGPHQGRPGRTGETPAQDPGPGPLHRSTSASSQAARRPWPCSNTAIPCGRCSEPSPSTMKATKWLQSV